MCIAGENPMQELPTIGAEYSKVSLQINVETYKFILTRTDTYIHENICVIRIICGMSFV